MARPVGDLVLRQRILSALVMAPPALAAVWFGGWAFTVLIAVILFLMVWEWHGMIRQSFGPLGYGTALPLAASVLVLPVMPWLSAALVVLAAMITVLRAGALRGWMGAGVFYLALPALALVWMRGSDDAGRQMIIWLFLLVWATDIGAYAFGRLIGGPLLLPIVSPKKTWAGLLGGAFCAAMVGLAAWALSGAGSMIFLSLFSAGLAVVAQIGDLFESWVKRRWGVKDSSSIIPGHGGVLDRVDGMMTVAVLVAVYALVSGFPVIQW